MPKQVYKLYEQMTRPTDQHFLVESEYHPKGDYAPNDMHSLSLSLRRPGDIFSFSEIVIEFRNGTPRIMVWGETDVDGSDPVVFEPNPDNFKYCLKCGSNWASHNDDGSCVLG